MRFFASAADWAVRHRSKLPRWLDRVIESAARDPDGLAGRLASRALSSGARGADVPVTSTPDTPVRVYIAPTNYSGQGYRWARALEAEDPVRIGARNVAVTLPGGFAFPADTAVPIATVNSSREWADAEWHAALTFTHVLVEAERSMFGRRFDRRLEDEVLALEGAGLSVAFLAHGTDIRDPDLNAERTPWSLYPEDPRTDVLRADAAANHAMLERLDRPTFVSTPDLLADVPWATWCPVVVDPALWANDITPFTRPVPRVMHISTAPLQKGSHYLAPALEAITAAGGITFEVVTGVPAASIPGLFADADIVLDQFRVGSYGVAACEAMASGRVVVGHVLPDVRRTVRDAYGLELPIVEADPSTVGDVVAALVADPDRSRAIAASGPVFVDRVHSGPASARALIDGWIAQASATR